MLLSIVNPLTLAKSQIAARPALGRYSTRGVLPTLSIGLFCNKQETEMPRTYITRTTHALFARHATPGAEFRDNSKPRLDGWLDLTLADDVAEVLEQRRMPGETDDDLLLRVLSGPTS